jgi:hypothetical protein
VVLNREVSPIGGVGIAGQVIAGTLRSINSDPLVKALVRGAVSIAPIQQTVCVHIVIFPRFRAGAASKHRAGLAPSGQWNGIGGTARATIGRSARRHGHCGNTTTRLAV